jgi:pyruvate dehydrogenase E1 component beta subunit
MSQLTSYGEAIRQGFRYLLSKYPKVFVMGQGLWSPWYVGSSMTDLDRDFGVQRIIDTPISELACTSAALGAALCGYRPIVVHPRVDFMVLASDSLVNQAAKWHHMFGGQATAPVTVRAIINRGGEQGAQHSQALHGWFAHIPGLRVVMPSTPADARNLLIAAVLCDDPVLYIDDRWLYQEEAPLGPPVELALASQGPVVVRPGSDVTLAGCGYSTHLCRQAADQLAQEGIECEVVDLRILNPMDAGPILASVRRTGRLLALDGDWSSCGLAGEVLARAVEHLEPAVWKARPVRLTLPDAPAPTSQALESIYYPRPEQVSQAVRALVSQDYHEARARSHGRGLRSGS